MNHAVRESAPLMYSFDQRFGSYGFPRNERTHAGCQFTKQNHMTSQLHPRKEKGNKTRRLEQLPADMKPFQTTQEPSSSRCDLNIIVEGKQYGAHWSILRDRSAFFDEFYRRKKVKRDGKICVHLQGVSSRLVGLFLQHVYMGNSKTEKPFQLELKDINDVLKFSIMFRLKDLQESKCRVLEEQLEESHRMSELHRNVLQFLYKSTGRYTTGNIATFVAHEAYKVANMECLFRVLKIVSCDGKKTTMRLKLLDLLITLFTACLDASDEKCSKMLKSKGSPSQGTGIKYL